MKKLIAQVTTVQRPATDQPFGGLKFTLKSLSSQQEVSQVVQETSVAFDDPANGRYILSVQAVNEDGTARTALVQIEIEVTDVVVVGTWPEPTTLTAEVVEV